MRNGSYRFRPGFDNHDITNLDVLMEHKTDRVVSFAVFERKSCANSAPDGWRLR